MKTAKLKNGEVRKVTDKHLEWLEYTGAGVEVKEEKTGRKTKEEKAKKETK